MGRPTSWPRLGCRIVVGSVWHPKHQVSAQALTEQTGKICQFRNAVPAPDSYHQDRPPKALGPPIALIARATLGIALSPPRPGGLPAAARCRVASGGHPFISSLGARRLDQSEHQITDRLLFGGQVAVMRPR